MTIELRSNEIHALHTLLIKAHRERRIAAISTYPHVAVTSTPPDRSTDPPTEVAVAITGTTADLAHVEALANDIKRVYNLHAHSDSEAHKTAVSAAVATADATDQTTSNALLNALSTAYGVHLTASDVHFTNDSTNVVTASAATNLATSQALAADLKAQLTAHMAAALPGTHIALGSS